MPSGQIQCCYVERNLHIPFSSQIIMANALFLFSLILVKITYFQFLAHSRTQGLCLKHSFFLWVELLKTPLFCKAMDHALRPKRPPFAMESLISMGTRDDCDCGTSYLLLSRPIQDGVKLSFLAPLRQTDGTDSITLTAETGGISSI